MRRKVTFFILIVATLAVAHEKSHHAKSHHKATVAVEEKSAIAEINDRYRSQVKPIFENKCFDCHSSKTRFPWYQKIPGIKQWIQHDIDEAKEHLNFEADFPFESHSEPIEDLAAIDEAISNGGMPPWRYRILHAGSALTADEKEIVHQWVLFGKHMLKEKAN